MKNFMKFEPEFWEKTGEYPFILAAAKAEMLDFAKPLAGKAERAADNAIFGSNAGQVLVEFKRNRGQTLITAYYASEQNILQLATGNWQLATGNWQLAKFGDFRN